MNSITSRLLAQFERIPKPPVLPGPSGDSATGVLEGIFSEAVPRWLATFIGVIGGVAAFMLILSGILFMTAYGNEERLTKAKKTATWAALGLLIALLSYTIVQIISSLPFTR